MQNSNASAPAGNSDIERSKTSEMDFGLQLLHALSHGHSFNVVLSPASIAIALGMLRAGANREIKDIMDRNFGLDEETPARHATYQTMISIVSGIWLPCGTELKSEYRTLIERCYKSELGNLDFVQDPKGAAQHINAFVSTATKEQINQVVGLGDVIGMNAVLVNALVFKATWEDTFDVEKTRNRTFHAVTGDIGVPTMHADGNCFPYAEVNGTKTLVLPLKGGLKVLFVLPRKGEGICSLLERLPAEFKLLTRSLSTDNNVDVAIPKFRLEGEFEIDRIEALSGARFSEMCNVDITLSKAIHKAVFEIDEEGARGAAVTTVFALSINESFVADRPFFAAVMDTDLTTLLFASAVQNPAVQAASDLV